MQTTRSPDPITAPTAPLREFRECVLSGIPVAPAVEARLEAQGINVGELRNRLMENASWQ